MLHSPPGIRWSLRALLGGLLAVGWGVCAMAQEPVAAPPASAPDRMQMDAYLALFRGDEARDEGRTAEAAEAYGEAVEAYRALQSTHPDYQASMVSYRLEHANRELAALDPPEPERTSQDVDGEAYEREQMNALETENRYLRGKVLALEEELEREDAPSPEQAEEVNRLTLRNQELSVTVSMLRKQLESAEVDRTTLRAARQEARELKAIVGKQRSQLADQRKRSEDLGALRERVTELSNRNRQLELAIKGAEQEANTIRRLEEELRILRSKAQLLTDDRNGLGDEVKALQARLETLQSQHKTMETSEAQAEKALAASLTEAQAFMERNGVLEQALAEAQAALEQVRGELLAAQAERAEVGEELADVEAELAALRRAHIQAEAKSAELGREVLGARNLKMELDEMESAHQAELAALREAHAEAMTARAAEAERELDILMTGHAAVLAEEVRLREGILAKERERHREAVAALVAEHAADLDDLKGAMQALKEDMRLSLDDPGGSDVSKESVAAVESRMETAIADELSAALLAEEEAELKATMLEEELHAARRLVESADELRRTIAELTEERSELRKQLDMALGEDASAATTEAPSDELLREPVRRR